MHKKIIFANIEYQLVNIYDKNPDRNRIQRIDSPVRQNLIDDNLRHQRRKNAQNLYDKNGNQHADKLFFEFQNRWNKPFEAEFFIRIVAGRKTLLPDYDEISGKKLVQFFFLNIERLAGRRIRNKPKILLFAQKKHEIAVFSLRNNRNARVNQFARRQFPRNDFQLHFLRRSDYFRI